MNLQTYFTNIDKKSQDVFYDNSEMELSHYLICFVTSINQGLTIYDMRNSLMLARFHYEFKHKEEIPINRIYSSNSFLGEGIGEFKKRLFKDLEGCDTWRKFILKISPYYWLSECVILTLSREPVDFCDVCGYSDYEFIFEDEEIRRTQRYGLRCPKCGSTSISAKI